MSLLNTALKYQNKKYKLENGKSSFQEGLGQLAALQLIISCCQEMYILFLLSFFFFQ